MPVKDLREIARKVQEEVARRYREELIRPARGYEEIWEILSPETYRKAKWLEDSLLREFSGLSLLDLYQGEELDTPYGKLLVLREDREVPMNSVAQDLCEAHLKRALRLLYGVGEATE